MSVTQIATDLYQIGLGGVNAFLIDENELILIDTGIPGSAQEIITRMVRKLISTVNPAHAASR